MNQLAIFEPRRSALPNSKRQTLAAHSLYRLKKVEFDVDGMMGSHLLKFAVPLVSKYGFTREALARSVLALPSPHAEPLSDTAVDVIFGRGNEARRTLINGWLDEGVKQMKTASVMTLKAVLRARLERNVPVLQHLPEAFAILLTPNSGIPPLDILPALKHAASIADEACYLTQNYSPDLSWYTSRASVAAIYAAAELHQITSPQTAYAFLDSLLESSESLSSVGDVAQYTSYVLKSWKGIIKSSGIL